MRKRKRSTKGRPTVLDWLYAHVSYSGDDCLTWPYSCARGYAQVAVGRKVTRASRLMCKLVHGDPPSPLHEAAHLCGKGNKGCVNPKHLTWKTRSENQLDRRQHGTAITATKGQAGVLSADELAAIRAAEGTTISIAARFGVSERTVLRAKRGDTYNKPRTRFLIEMVMREAGRPMSCRELARQLGISERTMGSTLSVLSREGFIVRVALGLYVLPAASVAA